MKLIDKNSGKNIITDKDVTITGVDNLGDTLSDVLKSHEDSLNKLKSNVKWLYKYGGVGSGGSGSGGSGGGGGNTSWGISVRLDGMNINNGSKVYLNKKVGEPYTMIFAISGGTSNYVIDAIYQYEDGTNVTLNVENVVLNSDNSWRITIPNIKFEKNGKFSISAIDQLTNVISNFEFEFIAVAYLFSSIKLFLDGTKLENSNILYDENTKLLLLEIDYNSALPLDKITYTWYVNDVPYTESPVIITGDNTKSGYIQLNLSEYLGNVGVKKVDCKISLYRSDSVTIIEETRSVNINIIPSNLYLLVSSEEPLTVQMPDLTSEPANFGRLDKQLNITVIPYDGNNTESSVTVTVKCQHYERSTGNWVDIKLVDEDNPYITVSGKVLNKIDIPNFVFLSSLENLNHKPGWKRIILSGTSGTKVTKDEESTYYIYIKERAEVLSWFNTNTDLEIEYDADSNKIIKYPYSLYFRKGDIGGQTVKNKTQENFSSFFSGKTFYENVSSNDEISIDLNSRIINNPEINNTGNGDLMISIGLSYSEINQITTPILSFVERNVFNEGLDDEESVVDNSKTINLYQNKVEITNKQTDSSNEEVNTELPIHINKINYSDYKNNHEENYDLIQILFTDPYIGKDSNSDLLIYHRKYYVYINGVIEKSNTNWQKHYHKDISKIIFHPGNYKVNLLDITYFPKRENLETKEETYIQNPDLCSYYYYLSYKYNNGDTDNLTEEKLKSIPEYSILTDLYNSKTKLISLDNNLLKIKNINSVYNIAKNAGIPSMLCKLPSKIIFNNNEVDTITDWLNQAINTEQDSDTGTSGKNLFESRVFIDSISWYNPNTQTNSNENNPFTKITQKLLWGRSGNSEEISELENNYGFYFRLQGSSTMRFKSKNLTLGFDKKADVEDDSGDTYKYLFSPNFKAVTESMTDEEKRECYNTFLPEQRFTLKADVVDSSHTNNCCLGRFINDVTESKAKYNVTGKYKDYVKSCLTGFPIILFIQTDGVVDGISESNYYYLGIYNFNLGRESYLNLGYINSEILEAEKTILDKNNGDFVGVKVANYLKHDKLVIAEIQGNKSVFDFHQFHESVLFPVTSNSQTKDVGAMFGDIIFSERNEYNEAYAKQKIQKFVEYIAKGGGYVFETIGKNLENINTLENKLEDSVAYGKKNTVPNYRNQVKRGIAGGAETFESTGNELPKSTINNLLDCLLGVEDKGVRQNPILDYKSLVNYYTICMVFGLVDSVQKNLNIKSWDGNEFGIYFYDMDTSFGISNAGTETSVFCFSDYWEENITDEGNNVYKLNGTNIFRDYFSTEEKEAGYDIPSSYLFAIAKYASSIVPLNSNWEDGTIIYPQNLWAKWRYTTDESIGNQAGILSTSDKFFNKYYKQHLKSIPRILLSLNFRNKYLYNGYGNSPISETVGEGASSVTYTGFSNTNITPFHGSRLEKVREWLNDRFHILDAYFNILGNTSVIRNSYYENGVEIGIITELPQNVSKTINNTDVIINNDIFCPTGETITREGLVDFKVKSKNFTPIVVNTASTINNYLLKDSSKTYHVTFNCKNQSTKIGGSSEWVWINSLNPFVGTMIKDNLFINTKKLEELESNATPRTSDNKLLNATIAAPAVKILKLNNSSYQFNLALSNDNNLNLETLDISSSNISISSDDELINLKTINLSYVGNNASASNTIKMLNQKEGNCNFIFNNSKFNTLELKAWKIEGNDYVINNESLDVVNLRVSTGIKGKTITVDSVPSLSSLTLEGFTSITILNCPKLKNIQIYNSSRNLETLSISNCSGLKSIKIPSTTNLKNVIFNNCSGLANLEFSGEITNIETLHLVSTSVKGINFGSGISVDNEGQQVLNLTGFTNLKNFNISGNSKVEYIKFKNEENNPFNLTNSFSNCTKLKRIYGHVKVTASGCFNNCKLFSIHGYTETTITVDGTEKNIITSDNIKFCGKSVIDNNGKVIHPKDYTDWLVTATGYSNKNWMKWQEGEWVTNMQIYSLIPANVTETLSGGSFYNTSLTLFDIYYVLQNIHPDDAFIRNSDFGGKAFASGSEVHEKRDCRNFTWLSNECDNSPNEHMFEDWGEYLKSVKHMLYYRCKNSRIRSTKLSNSGEVLEKGFFYYLKNALKNGKIQGVFNGGVIYTDNDLFRFEENIETIPSTFSYTISGNCLINGYSNQGRNNINNYLYTDIFEDNENHELNSTILTIENNEFKYLGDYNNFFSNILFKNGGSTSSNSIIQSMTSCSFVNYNKSNLFGETNDSSKHLERLRGFLNSTYACGEIKLEKIFKNWSKVKEINGSFRVNSVFNNNTYATFILNNDTFSYLNKNIFTDFGYIVDNVSSESSKILSYISFYGNGILKLLDNSAGESGYINILKDFKYLKTASGLFAQCKVTNYGNPVSIPSKLFDTTIRLAEIQYCFYNFSGEIKLTSGGFGKCSELSNLSNLFCIDDSCRNTQYLGNYKKPYGITTCIPNKFFYHGNASTDKTVYHFGVNSNLEDLILTNGWVDANDATGSLTFTTITNISEDERKTVKYTVTDASIKEISGKEVYYVHPTTSMKIETIIYNSSTKEQSINSTVIQIGELLQSKDNVLSIIFSNEIFTNMTEDTVLIHSDSLTVPVYNRNIVDLTNCFKNQVHIKHYEFGKTGTYNDVKEGNEDFLPYKYYLKDNTWLERPETSGENDYILQRHTSVWYFDGNQSDTTGKNIADSLDAKNRISSTGTKEEVRFGEKLILPGDSSNSPNESKNNISNFSCPPDLFRFCNNKTELKITGVFDSCGYTNNNNIKYNISEDTINNFASFGEYGITGRICPYLLKPISNVTNISRLFKNNKLLSSYYYENIDEERYSDTYLIPENFFKYTKNIKTLEETFSGLNWPRRIKLDGLFDNLESGLILVKTFYKPYYSIEKDSANIYIPTVISGVFINNTIEKAVGVFSTGVDKAYMINNDAPHFGATNINLKVIYKQNFDKSKVTTLTDNVKENYYGYYIDPKIKMYNEDNTSYSTPTYSSVFSGCFDSESRSLEFPNIIDTSVKNVVSYGGSDFQNTKNFLVGGNLGFD